MTTIIEPRGYWSIMAAIERWQGHEITWRECVRLCGLTAEQEKLLDPIQRQTAREEVDRIVREIVG